MTNAKFYYHVRHNLFGGRMTQVQVNCIEALVAACKRHGVTSKAEFAYILATVYHETDKTFNHKIEEYGKGKGKRYGRRLTMNGKPYTEPHIYYGRGLVQLTWWDNYKKVGDALGIDLLNNPSIIGESIETACDIVVLGMRDGWFTGKKLSDYFGGKYTPEKGAFYARYIINGTDKRSLIKNVWAEFMLEL